MSDTGSEPSPASFTELPDPVSLVARLGQVLEARSAWLCHVAVVSPNRDCFRLINHNFGHEVGDKLLLLLLLLEVAHRIGLSASGGLGGSAGGRPVSYRRG